jgi:hypothetical protein
LGRECLISGCRRTSSSKGEWGDFQQISSLNPCCESPSKIRMRSNAVGGGGGTRLGLGVAVMMPLQIPIQLGRSKNFYRSVGKVNRVFVLLLDLLYGTIEKSTLCCLNINKK